ncbi:unnamed protein product, partial [Mesorhabditis spiculigera]
MVSMQKDQHPGFASCGGSIIDYDWVLTAAHCVFDYNTETVRQFVGESVVAGTSWLNATAGTPGMQRIAIERGYIHPEFTGKTLDHDVGLLKLKTQFKYDAHVHPIMLWRARMPAGIDVNMIGWGNIYVVPKEQRVQPMQLRGFIGQMVPEEECRKLNTMTHAACFDGGKKHSGVCNGDSGSPISTYAPAINKQSYYVQVSLVSTGNGPKDGTGNCGKDETTWTFGPEIAMYCDWIGKVTGKKLCLSK